MWGKNDYGQLGDGTVVTKNYPVLISVENKIVASVVPGVSRTGVVATGILCFDIIVFGLFFICIELFLWWFVVLGLCILNIPRLLPKQFFFENY